MKTYFIATVMSVLVSVGAAGQNLERVNAGDFFDSHAGKIVYIELADTQVLVFRTCFCGCSRPGSRRQARISDRAGGGAVITLSLPVSVLQAA